MSQNPPPYPPLSPPPGSVEEALTQALTLARAKSDEAAQRIAEASKRLADLSADRDQLNEAANRDIKKINALTRDRDRLAEEVKDLRAQRKALAAALGTPDSAATFEALIERVSDRYLRSRNKELQNQLAAAEAEVSRVANRAAAESAAMQERLGVALGLEHPRSCDFDELIRRVEADAKATSSFRRAVETSTIPGGWTIDDVLRAARAAVETSKAAGCLVVNLPMEVRRFTLVEEALTQALALAKDNEQTFKAELNSWRHRIAAERETSEHRAASIVLKKRAAKGPAAWAFGDETPPSKPSGPVLKYTKTGRCMKTGRSLIGEFKRGSAGAAGIDLPIVNSRINIDPGGTLRLYTGIKIEIPPGYEGQIRPRSSAAALGLVIDGTIDADYRGEVMVVVTNASRYPAVIDRPIAQLVIAPVAMLQPVEVDSLSETKRGAGGFGSTDGGVS